MDVYRQSSCSAARLPSPNSPPSPAWYPILVVDVSPAARSGTAGNAVGRFFLCPGILRKKPPDPTCRRGDDSRRPEAARNQFLDEHADDHAAVLRAALTRVVRRDGIVGAVTDHVDLVQRNLVLLVQVAPH